MTQRKFITGSAIFMLAMSSVYPATAETPNIPALTSKKPTPQKSAAKHKKPPFDQVGTASWYGPGFRGKKTASGQVLDPNALTAAHRSLPLDSRVRVTNLQNGKSVTVVVNDRGPFHAGRVIDLSVRAAERLDITHAGTAKVRIEALTLEQIAALPDEPTRPR